MFSNMTLLLHSFALPSFHISWGHHRPVDYFSCPFLPRYCPRFFDLVGYQTTNASIRNKHFSPNNDLVRLTKIMNNLFKDLKILSFKVIFQCLKSIEFLYFLEKFGQFQTLKMTLKLRILWSLTRLFIILVSLTRS